MTKEPKAEPFWVQATCCFCGDKSYIKPVYGEFSYGPIAIDHESDPTADKMVLTQIGDMSTMTLEDGRDVVLFQTLKGKDSQ